MNMTQQTGLTSPGAAVAVAVTETATNRKQPLLLASVMSLKDEKKIMMSRDIRHRNRVGEVAGGTAAECAAVCCCCPCTVVHLIVLAVYTLPTGLLKKALRKSKRKRGKKRKNKISCSSEKKNQWTTIAQNVETTTSDESERGEDTLELDSEMWDRFHGAGFWRSSSQREK